MLFKRVFTSQFYSFRFGLVCEQFLKDAKMRERSKYV